MKVSKILSGEASSFEDCHTNQDKLMKAVQPIKEPKLSSNPLGVQYNNCTVNMYSSVTVAPVPSSVLSFFPYLICQVTTHMIVTKMTALNNSVD